MKIIFSSGDTNGIGLETFFSMIKFLPDTWKNTIDFALAINSDVLGNYASKLGIDIKILNDSFEISGKKVNIVDCENSCNVDFGKIDRHVAIHALESFQKSIDLLKSGSYDALVTLPINKEAMSLTGWHHPGHTEMIAEAFGVQEPLMILLTGNFRVALATIHIPLQKVARDIKKEKILDLLSKFNNSLKLDFGIEQPKIAVLGLNPHAGENGTIGYEERDIITPAIIDLKNAGVSAFGPYPADGFFARESWRTYDGVFAMYHDQGLIPLKMEARGAGVNYTAGLPVVRTSPDHGTAFEIAGKGLASHSSLISAVETALQIVGNRSKRTPLAV